MALSSRQQQILEFARINGRVEVDELARKFDVTPQTIRRDLNDLRERGLLSRTHGGATPATSVANVDYAKRRDLAAEAKLAIAAAAADLIGDHSSLFINIGTTTEQVARALYGRTGLVVITNNINVVNILSGSPGKELILAGGAVRQTDGAIVGEAAVEFIRQFKVDCAVIGASALDEEGDILDFDIREVSVARAIIENARKTILAADRTKFERTVPVRIAGLEAIDTIVTDAPPPQAFVAACKRANTRLVIAPAHRISTSGVTAHDRPAISIVR